MILHNQLKNFMVFHYKCQNSRRFSELETKGVNKNINKNASKKLSQFVYKIDMSAHLFTEFFTVT